MAEPKDGESFFRKVVRFVANPATDWAELNSRQDEGRDLDIEKSELKAMIERKRRNDFVRKREFDMLRKVRREGLSSEHLAALGGSSRLDDSEVRLTDSGAKQDVGVKAKIDEIEQQMVGDGFSQRRPAGFFEAPTQPSALSSAQPRAGVAPVRLPMDNAVSTQRSTSAGSIYTSEGPRTVGAGLSPLSRSERPPAEVELPTLQSPLAAMEVSEVVHDPELDEAVIAFANADFTQCEQALQQLTASGGQRAQHAETWLVLFDLYRATGQQHKFEALAMDYARQFGWSSPQWFSMPRLVAEAAGEDKAQLSRSNGEIGWVCPEVLDTEVVAGLRSQTLQMPLPWVFEWGALRRIEPEAAGRLGQLLHQWAGEPLDMRWLSGDNFFQVLQEAAPTGVRDVDPVYWTVRLEALRLANRPDQFDEAAIDYCVTYEVSPPQWEKSRCRLHVSGSGPNTHAPPLSAISEISTSFLESSLTEDAAGVVRSADVELAGQLVGDIGATLAQIDRELGNAPLVNVSCTRLIRVDFIAAGDLLNWVLAKRSENRAVGFSEAHRLVALFFGAMGINEHARVRVSTV
jgi:hypothetical protein